MLKSLRWTSLVFILSSYFICRELMNPFEKINAPPKKPENKVVEIPKTK